jgi:hypothetical protein
MTPIEYLWGWVKLWKKFQHHADFGLGFSIICGATTRMEECCEIDSSAKISG